MAAERYIRVTAHGHPNARANGSILEHVLVMSEILGRALTEEEVVHHKDNNSKNNLPGNLQLFATNAEHTTFHARERAELACGNASFMKCVYCGEYDDPAKMYVRKRSRQAWHRECAAQNMMSWKASKLL